MGRVLSVVFVPEPSHKTLRFKLKMCKCLDLKTHCIADMDDSASVLWQNIFLSVRPTQNNSRLIQLIVDFLALAGQ